MDYKEWIAAENEKDAFERPELEALEAYLNESSSLSEAVQRITARSNTWATSQPARVSWMLLHLARNCPDVHERIIDVIKAIFMTPHPKDNDEIDWEQESGCFSLAWREMHDSESSSYSCCVTQEINRFAVTTLAFDETQNAVSDEAARHLINFHAFTAACIAEGISLLSLGWGFFAVVQGIEKNLQVPIDRAQNVRVIAAAQYFIHAAWFILNFPPDRETHVVWERDSELWNGKKGYSLDRWAWWKQRWEELRQNQALSDGAREAARQSEVAMSKAERRKDKKGKKN